MPTRENVVINSKLTSYNEPDRRRKRQIGHIPHTLLRFSGSYNGNLKLDIILRL